VNSKRIAILGTGSMGGAILHGLLAAGVSASNVSVSTKSEASAAKLRDELGVSAFSCETSADANSATVANADVVLVGVKPGYVVEVLTEVAGLLKANALVISVAAGITTAAMEAAVSNAVVRAMPNTPSVVGRGVTGIAKGSRASEVDIATATKIFESVGKVLVIDESQIDALSTISGSGPAYVFYLIEQFTATAESMGFTAEQAEVMVHDTFLGASELLAASGKSPAELRKQVTSPNGTTMRAVAVLEEAKLKETFDKATAAALARAKEIAEGNL
jgi:pyrroline-5-carboxylate reductase